MFGGGKVTFCAHRLGNSNEFFEDHSGRNILFSFSFEIFKSLLQPKNTGHLEWNPLGDFSEFKTNGDSKDAL